MPTTINDSQPDRFGVHTLSLTGHRAVFHVLDDKSEVHTAIMFHEDFVAAVEKETGSVLIEPKKSDLPAWEFTMLTGVDISPGESAAPAHLREAAAHLLALANEREEKEAKIDGVALFLGSHGVPVAQADEIAEALVVAGLTVKEEA